jgi:hypothetical protein
VVPRHDVMQVETRCCRVGPDEDGLETWPLTVKVGGGEREERDEEGVRASLTELKK